MSKDSMKHSKIGATCEVNELRTSSSSTFITESEKEIVAKVEIRVSSIRNILVEHGEGLH